MKKNKNISFRIIKYALRSKWLVISTIIITVIVSYTSNIGPIISKNIIDDFLSNKANLEVTERLLGLNKNMWFYILAVGSTIILRYILSILFSLTAMKLERDIRVDAMKKMGELPTTYYDLEPDGKIVTKINNDANGVRSFYSTIFNLIQAGLNLVVVYSSLVYLNKKIAIALLVLIPLVYIWVTFFRKYIHNFNLKIRENSAQINAKINEIITGVNLIQMYNQENHMLNEYNNLVVETNGLKRKLSIVQSSFGMELIYLVQRILTCLVLGYFAYLVLGPEILVTSGMIYAVTNYVDKIVQPLNQIFNNLNGLEDSIVSAYRIFGFIDEPIDSKIYDGEDCLTLASDIEFKNVNFSYTGSNLVLKNINLRIKKGEKIGIVGHTGSGKSTLMNLLLRFNDFEEGEILINGHDIRDYNKRFYRRHLGIVLQTPSLFYGTIRDNITLGNKDIQDCDIVKVIKYIGATKLLTKTENGLDTMIAYHGDNLSVGEKQLIAFSRILLYNPDIFILDEATANIDTETELLLQKATEILAKERTTIIIAHRLSTIKDADRIIVIDNGNITHEGSHQYLYDNSDIYRNMYDAQYKNI